MAIDSMFDVVILGGGLAGQLSGFALANTGLKVALIERGGFCAGEDSRYVPQQHHVHLLLTAGAQALEQIFPGLFEEIRRNGAVNVDQGHGVKCFDGLRWRQRATTGVYADYFSRQLLNEHTARRVRSNKGIRLFQETRINGLLLNDHDNRVEGVVVSVGNQTQKILARLVIDAGGRNSKLLRWLKDSGIHVKESHIRTDMGYVSQKFKCPSPYCFNWRALLALPRLPECRRMAAICCIENDEWQVTAGGWFGEFPKRDVQSFRQFLEDLPIPDFVEAIDKASPISELSLMTVTGSLWRHYENCDSIPTGLLVVGDALCSLNPLYSQGMTVSAMQVVTLAQHINRLNARTCTTQELQRLISEVVQPAWCMAAAEDLRLPEVTGQRSSITRLRQWYFRKVNDLAATDRVVLQRVLSCTHLISPARSLFQFDVLKRVLGSLVPTDFSGGAWQ